jgi:RNA polymerase sigma factor (sigma-70 family)
LYSQDAGRRDEAARRIWERFSARLVGEVHRRLNAQIRQRVDAEDVIQSLFERFFAAGPGPGGPPRNRAEFWRLLVHITICTVADTVDHHRAKRRDVRREEPLGHLFADADSSRPSEPMGSRGIDPADEAIARIEFARLLGLLPDDLREVLVMRLQGYTNAQIGAHIGRVERTVELKLRTIRELVRPHIEGAPSPPADEP